MADLAPLLACRQGRLGFTEQFVIDVAGVTGALRADVAERMGPGPMLEFVVALFALDYGAASEWPSIACSRPARAAGAS